MKNINIYDDYDRYYEEEDKQHKLHTKNAKKFKGKGHQSKHQNADRWEAVTRDDVEEVYTDTMSHEKFVPASQVDSYKAKTPTTATTTPTQYNKPKQFTPGVNTKTIQGQQIDFDRLDGIEKVDSSFKNKQTYGIKFLFSGKNHLYRVAWFNINQKERDMVYERELAFWKSLPSTQRRK